MLRPRPFPFAKTVVSLSALTMFGAFGGQALLPNGEPAYSILNVAKVIEKPTTLGVADSDLTNMSDADVAKTLDKLQSIGVNDVRLFIPWADVETSKGVYDWTKIDKIMNAAKARDMGVIATITHSPDWAVTDKSHPARISPPTNPADYGDFAAAVAEKYKGIVSGYEIWNDTNSGYVYGGKADPTGYTALLQNAYEKIKTVDPSITVIAGVFGAIPTSATDLNAPTFLDQMYTAGAKNYFDAISYHPYQYTTPYSQGGTLQGSPLNEVKQMRAIMMEKGDGTKLIWASEYGFPTSAAGGETQQQAYIADFIKAWSTQEGAGPMFIYTTRDQVDTKLDPPPPADASQEVKDAYYEKVFGIYRYDWSAKPAAQTIADFIASQKPVAAPPNVLAVFFQNFVAAITQAFTNYTSLFANAINSFFQAIQRIFAPQVAGPPANTGGTAPGSGGPNPNTLLRVAAVAPTTPAQDDAPASDAPAPQALIATQDETSTVVPAPQSTSSSTSESSAPVVPTVIKSTGTSAPVTPSTGESSPSATTPSSSSTPSTSAGPSITAGPTGSDTKSVETVGAAG
ncbi:cellulase family glycosylhydrolase [Williamsia herbipolensis]|uniref:cellulase family glycosylhydrolase n=1 Tax=Williamsia herbipolensis TaxID=1603258 RepID=UPI0009E59A9B|nr:cellulase family glycosylhydrolase [Williamsia herbipolensis]